MDVNYLKNDFQDELTISFFDDFEDYEYDDEEKGPALEIMEQTLHF